jgi:hypothetical protein
MTNAYSRVTDYTRPPDEGWEVIPEKGWTFDRSPGCARLRNPIDQRAEIYLRPCLIYGDTVEIGFVRDAPRRGVFQFGFLAGFEFITFEMDFEQQRLAIRTHEFHKSQPRFAGRFPVGATALRIVRRRDRLPGLPYEGSRVDVFCDGALCAEVGAIDFLPESLFMFGLKGAGEVSLSSFAISGGARPRPEYVHIGAWQQSIKPTTAENVECLIEGVRQAARAGVRILVTPETSLTGLRESPELHQRSHIQAELKRFRKAVAGIRDAPYTLVGYPEWIDGAAVDGATLKKVRVNAHRFVRPDGSLGPMMAKVHSCEAGLWHGRRYNLQRVAGVEVAVGVCHDGHYQDVWATGVMGGARLCLHPSAGGNLSGSIPAILDGYRNLGGSLDAFWVRVNAGGGTAIVYPVRNRKQPDTLLAVPKDLTRDSPTYPAYSTMGDLLAHATVRLWDATGCYPLRTLRSGKAGYKAWQKLVPEIVDV